MTSLASHVTHKGKCWGVLISQLVQAIATCMQHSNLGLLRLLTATSAICWLGKFQVPFLGKKPRVDFRNSAERSGNISACDFKQRREKGSESRVHVSTWCILNLLESDVACSQIMNSLAVWAIKTPPLFAGCTNSIQVVVLHFFENQIFRARSKPRLANQSAIIFFTNWHGRQQRMNSKNFPKLKKEKIRNFVAKALASGDDPVVNLSLGRKLTALRFLQFEAEGHACLQTVSKRLESSFSAVPFKKESCPIF